MSNDAQNGRENQLPEPEANTPMQRCSSRSCLGQPVGIGPVSGLVLCAAHLERDTLKAANIQTKLLRSLRLLREPDERQQALRNEYESLTLQLADVQVTFDAMRDSIQQWSDKVVSQLQQAQDSVAKKLADTTEAMDCEKELTLAGSEGDKRRMMELLKSTELWVEEVNERSVEFRRTRGSTNHLVTGVKQLQQVIDRQIAQVIASPAQPEASAVRPSASGNLTGASPQPLYPVINLEPSLTGQLQEPSAPPPPPQQVCRLLGSVDSLASEPHHVTVCTNTAVFVCDSNNRVAKAKPDVFMDEQLPLPQPAIFVSFLPECVDYLLVTSLTGHAKIRFHCYIDWPVWINGLYCDNARQLLFIAQANVVTVATLSGEVTRVISAKTLGLSIDWISSIAVSDSQVLILDITNNSVLCVDRDSGKLASVVRGDSDGNQFGGIHELSQLGDALLVVAKNGQVHRLSLSDPSRRLSSLSVGFQRLPWKLVADSAGCLLFGSDPDNNTVRVLSIDGAGAEQQPQSLVEFSTSDAASVPRRPLGLAVVQLPGQSARRLVVADSVQLRLLVYEILWFANYVEHT